MSPLSSVLLYFLRQGTLCIFIDILFDGAVGFGVSAEEMCELSGASNYEAQPVWLAYELSPASHAHLQHRRVSCTMTFSTASSLDVAREKHLLPAQLGISA